VTGKRAAAHSSPDQFAPIGLLDSGLGGLSIVQALQQAMPAETLLYYADSAFCPYGERAEAFIRDRTLTIATALHERGIKALVIACNTACAAALDHVRATIDIPVIGLEPAVKPAVALTRSGRVAVFATPRTIASKRLALLLERYASGVEVDLISAPAWVDLVERGLLSTDEAFASVASLVQPAIHRGADVLVLGCTHFPFLAPLIREVAGPRIELVDSGHAIARRTSHVLDEHNLTAPATKFRPQLRVMTSAANPSSIAERAARMLGVQVRLA